MNTNKQTRLIIVSAPSGSGKTTIVKHLLSVFPSLAFSVSATSRKIRNGETDGKDYFFISEDEFRKRIDRGDLLEWQEVYSGSLYGTLRSEIDKLLAAGKNVIFDVDVVGGLNIKKEFGERALAVFVCPPSIEALEQRLNCRNTDSPETIKKRVEKAVHEMTYIDKFDFVLMNKDLQEAKKEIVKRVDDFLKEDC
ncbi:MAG TPA: guanylate kinase [Lentimicrobium sp.]|nr:guanylate kinase [Lentimicrobium sp.]